MLIRTGLAVLAATLLAGCASLSEHTTGLTDAGTLHPCPAAPRCVSSQAEDPERRVRPLTLVAADEETWQQLLAAVQTLPRTQVVTFEPNYLRAEVISPWRVYTDDVELLRQSDGVTLDVRSTGRIGYYDFEVNRERVDAWRAALAAAGVLVESPR